MDLITNDIKGQGYRITKVRRALLVVLSHSQKPLSVQEILKLLLRKDVSANKTTIYRELEFLKSIGIVESVEFGDRKTRYELNTGKHHHHIVCLKCERVSDVELDVDLKKAEYDIEKETGYKIYEHSIELFGICKTCQ